MAPRKKESAIALCDKAVVLGNTIAIRMLEYLSTVKHQVQGFRELATEFLDVSRILWAIESGLSSNHNSGALPADMQIELEKRFRQTHDDFVVLNSLVTRFLENDKKHGFARLSKGFKMMFADSDVFKIRASLEKSREALRMSALVFRWSLGDDEVDSTISIGYTGLAAALDRMSGVDAAGMAKRPTMTGPGSSGGLVSGNSVRTGSRSHRSPSFNTTNNNNITPSGAPPSQQLPPGPFDHHPRSMQGHSMISNERGDSTYEPTAFDMPPALPPLDSGPERLDFMGNRVSHQGDNDAFSDNESHERAPSIIRSLRSSKAPTSQSIVRELTVSEMSSPTSGGRSTAMGGDTASTHTAETDTLLEDLLSEADLNDPRDAHTSSSGSAHTQTQQLQPFTRIKVDLNAVPRWSPRANTGANNPQYKGALVQAVQKRAHKAMEQLMDRGTVPDSITEVSLLREAVHNHDAEAVRLLLLFGADPNTIDRHGSTPLYAATEAGFVDAARMLLKYGADPNTSAGPNADTPLALAVLDGKMELVQLLLAYGGDPNRIMANGNSVMVRSIDRKVPKKLVELLLHAGSDPNSKNGEGTSPLFQAISVQRLDIGHLLLERGADPNLPGPKHVLWPSVYQPPFLRLLLARGADFRKAPGIMELATSINNIESVRTLLTSGVDPNAKKDGVYTPLCSAIRDNRGDIVTLLLANGADPNVPASEYPCFKCVTHQRAHLLPQVIEAGGDPNEPRGIIEKAVLHDNKDALIFLLDYGVDVNAKSSEGYTPLTTCIREDRADMIDLLLARGADPAIRGQDWPINLAVKRPNILKKLLPAVSNPKNFRGVVEMAVCANQLESIRLLLSAGFSVEDKNGGVFSPLTSAIREGHKDIVRYLIDEAGANVNAPGEHLPIIKAIRRMRGQDTELLELLLARGADINLMYRGWNAVLQAVENGDLQVLRILVEKGNGVDLEQTDESGRTVMEIVQGHGWDEAVAVINKGRRMSVFSSLSWGTILGENGSNGMPESITARTSMEPVDEGADE